MAITAAQQTQLYNLAVGMFGAAPGLTYTDAWAHALEAGMTITQIYEALTSSPEFESLDVGFTRAATNEQFAGALVEQLLGSTLTLGNRAIGISFVLSQLDHSLTRGQAIKSAIDALDATPASDPNFGAAAQQLDNRVEAARLLTEIVGVTTTDLNRLRSWIAVVTEDPATVTEAIPDLDRVVFALTTNPDNIVGTRFRDFIASTIDAATPANSTFTAADTVNGGGSTNDFFRITVTGGIGSLPTAHVSNIEQFFIRDRGVGGTYNFSLYDGETLVANELSTAPVTLSDIAPGAKIQIQGDGTTPLGPTTFTMASATADVTLNIDGKVVGDPNITRAQTGAVTVVVNSTGGDNTVGTIDLDTATALTGLVIDVRGGDLTAKLAQDYAPGSKLTVIGGNDLDLLGAPLSANFTLVDASAQRAGSTKVLLSGNNTSFLGGFGNDFVAVDTNVFNARGNLDGGGGSDVLSGGRANDTFKGGNGIDSINVSQGGDDTINFEGIVATANGDIVTGFTAGAFSSGSGVDRLEMADADATTPFGAASGTMQTITSAPTSAVTFITAANNVLELAFELRGNGEPNDLDTVAGLDGTALLAALGQTVSVSATTNAGYIIAYQENKAYVYHLVEGADGDADLAAADIALVGRFDNVGVGAFDATSFVDAV
jgi:hypothetical protein